MERHDPWSLREGKVGPVGLRYEVAVFMEELVDDAVENENEIEQL